MILTLHSMSLSHHFCPEKNPKRIFPREFFLIFHMSIAFLTFGVWLKNYILKKIF